VLLFAYDRWGSTQSMPQATTKAFAQRLYRSRNPYLRSFYIYITSLWPAPVCRRIFFKERRALRCCGLPMTVGGLTTTYLTERLYRSRNPQARSFYIYITFIWLVTAAFRFFFIERRALRCCGLPMIVGGLTTTTLTKRLYR
jgi:hypothetical protein